MKFFIAFALIAAVASAGFIRPTPVSQEMAEIAQIVAAIQSPSTDPATAVALEAMLAAALGLHPSPIAVGPAIVDFPLPDGGAVDPTPVVVPSPVIVGDNQADASPLVQIIVNIKNQEAVIAPAPVEAGVVEEVYVPGPVNVVDNVVAPVEPVHVAEPTLPVVVDPVQVVEPEQVVEPIVVEPVIVGTPIIAAPVVALPDDLN